MKKNSGNGFREEQEKKILDLLNANGSVTVTELEERLGISSSTARLRLKALEAEGFLTRTHGGAMRKQKSTRIFHSDEIVNLREKTAIAREALKELRDNEVIALGSCTSTQIFARELCASDTPRGLAVVTNSIYVAAELINRPNTEVRVCGGVLESNTGSCYGEQCEKFFSNIFVSKTFLSVDSVTLEHGFTQRYIGCLSDEVLLRHRGDLYMLVDHTKLSQGPFLEKICMFHEVKKMIMDEAADPGIVRQLREAGLNVALAPL